MDSSSPLFSIAHTPSRSFSRCFQKNSGSALGLTDGVTSVATSPSDTALFEQVQINAECSKARMIQTAKGDNCLSDEGSAVLSFGFPRSWPVFVASLLKYYYIIV